MITPRALVLVLALSVLSAACDRGAIEPQLELGVTTCHRCNSVIVNKSWAAADRRAGTIRLYDDPGCLLATLREEGTTETDVVFQDHTGSGRWLDASEAWLAWAKSFESPQGTNWAAYPTFAAAQNAITSSGSGRIVRFEEAAQPVPPPQN